MTTTAPTKEPASSEAIRAAIADEMSRRLAADPIAKLERELEAAEAAEAEAPRLAEEAAARMQDRATAAVFEGRAETANMLELAIGQYVTAWDAMFAPTKRQDRAGTVTKAMFPVCSVSAVLRMARLARIVVPDLPHHVSSRGNGRTLGPSDFVADIERRRAVARRAPRSSQG